VNALGHAHPKLVAALNARQAGALWHTSNLYHIPALSEAFADLFGRAYLCRQTVFLLTNSGTEAVRSWAVKDGPQYWVSNKGERRRSGIITFDGASMAAPPPGSPLLDPRSMTRGFGPLAARFPRTFHFGDQTPCAPPLPTQTAAGFGGACARRRRVPGFCPDALPEGLRDLCDETRHPDDSRRGANAAVRRTGKAVLRMNGRGLQPDIMMMRQGPIGGGFPWPRFGDGRWRQRKMTAGTHTGQPMAAIFWAVRWEVQCLRQVADAGVFGRSDRKAALFSAKG